MRTELGCDEIRVELSARLDQEVSAETSRMLDEHLASCEACSAHETSLRAVKRAVALQAAPSVRDIAPSVMSRVTADRRDRGRERRSLLRTALATAAATAVLLGGAIAPWRTSSDGIAIASEITRAVQRAAGSIDSYRAEFRVTETGWHPDVPERSFDVEILYEAPERLRIDVHDLTEYPQAGWPTNDASLIANASRWWLRETASCPAAALPGCSIAPRPEIRALEQRQPFDGSTALPTDLILPLETLADSQNLQVIGREVVNGHDAQHLRLQYWQATPLIDSLQFAGTWHRFSPSATVDIWVDARSWFPLRFSIQENGSRLVVEATSLEDSPELDGADFAPPAAPSVRDGGFRRGPRRNHAVPSYLADLAPYRSGVTRDGQTVDSYVAGMTWMKVLTDRAKQPTLTTFTNEVVSLGEGFGYFEASSDSLRRAIEVFGGNRRVRIESNLPRREIVAIAASLPITGRAVDRLELEDGTKISRISETTLDDVGYASVPRYLPDGYRFSSGFLSSSSHGDEQLVSYYRPAQSAALRGAIKLTQQANVSLLPPTSEDLISVRLGDTTARWSAERGELEWLDGTTYRAVAVPSFDLQTAVRIAQTMR